MRRAKTCFDITEEMANLIKQVDVKKGKILLTSTALYVSYPVVKIPVDLSIDPVFISNSLAVYLKKQIIGAPFTVCIENDKLLYQDGNFKLSLLLVPAPPAEVKAIESQAKPLFTGKYNKIFEALDLFVSKSKYAYSEYKHIISFGDGTWVATKHGIAIKIDSPVVLPKGLYSYETAKANHISIEETYEPESNLTTEKHSDRVFNSDGFVHTEVSLQDLANHRWDVIEGVNICTKEASAGVDKEISNIFKKMLKLYGNKQVILYTNSTKPNAVQISFSEDVKYTIPGSGSHVLFTDTYKFKIVIARDVE